MKSVCGTRNGRQQPTSQPAAQTHASLDGILVHRSSLFGDQIGPTREHTLGWNTGRGDGKIISCDACQTRILASVVLPPCQNIHMRVDHGSRQISLQLAPSLETSSLGTREKNCTIRFTQRLTLRIFFIWHAPRRGNPCRTLWSKRSETRDIEWEWRKMTCAPRHCIFMALRCHVRDGRCQ